MSGYEIKYTDGDRDFVESDNLRRDTQGWLHLIRNDRIVFQAQSSCVKSIRLVEDAES